MERIKDFFHDFSDIFFAIIISSIMFVVLTINLGGWFRESFNAASANEPVNASENRGNNYINSNPSNNNVNLEDENNQLEAENGTDKIEIEKPPNNTNLDINGSGQKNEMVGETKKIIVPDGTFCTGIAKILKDNKLIDNENNFIQAAESLKLSGRLKSGSFEIPVDTAVEDMVKIIAGQKTMVE